MITPNLDPTSILDTLQRESPAGAYCQNRIFEWSTASMMIGIALCVLITPKTIDLGAFRLMTDAGFSALPVGITFAIVGAVRFFALYRNGRMQPYGAWMRAGGAMIAAFMWFQMCLALVLLTELTGTLSIGIPVYAVLTAAEVYSCYRAAADEISRPVV
jgi:hypothetical protein